MPEPSLLVDTGDPFVGTAYFQAAGPTGMARVMRAMGYKAIAVRRRRGMNASTGGGEPHNDSSTAHKANARHATLKTQRTTHDTTRGES